MAIQKGIFIAWLEIYYDQRQFSVTLTPIKMIKSTVLLLDNYYKVYIMIYYI